MRGFFLAGDVMTLQRAKDRHDAAGGPHAIAQFREGRVWLLTHRVEKASDGRRVELGARAAAMRFRLDRFGKAKTLEQANDRRKIDVEQPGQLPQRVFTGLNRRDNPDAKVDRNGSHLRPPC